VGDPSPQQQQQQQSNERQILSRVVSCLWEEHNLRRERESEREGEKEKEDRVVRESVIFKA